MSDLFWCILLLLICVEVWMDMRLRVVNIVFEMLMGVVVNCLSIFLIEFVWNVVYVV